MRRTLPFSNHVSGRLKFILLRWVESEQKIPNQIPEIDYITLQVQYHILSYQSGNTLALKGNKFHKVLKTPPIMVTVQFILTGRDLQDKNNVYTVDLNRGTILRV